MIRAAQLDREPKGVIFDVKRYAIHDGPGIRTTVFFKGCPLRCRWCHNPESWVAEPQHGFRAGRCAACGQCVEECSQQALTLSVDKTVGDPSRCTFCGACVDACPNEAREIIGRPVSAREVIAVVEKDVVFYDQSGGGVTFSGGEPLMQAEFLHDLLRECALREIHTTVDTSCYAEPAVIDRISERADLLLCDLKHMDSATHERHTGAGNELVLANIRRLAVAGRNIVLRIPVVPDINDDEENIEASGRFAASLGRDIRIDLLPYNGGGREKARRLAGEYDMLEAASLDDERMHAIADQLRSLGLTVTIGG